MGRSVAVVGILLMLVACSGTGWIATRLPLVDFLLPDATEVQVTPLRWNEWQLSYHTPETPATWAAAVGHNLEMNRWSSSESLGYGGLTRIYTRATSFGFCALWEWAFLHFDPARPHVAQIRIRRWIAIAWRYDVLLQTPARSAQS